MTTRTILILIFLAMLSSCIEEFYPQIDENEYLLVVDGGISNEEGPYVVNLSVTSGLEKVLPVPVRNANVYIIEEGGQEELLNEAEPGKYQSNKNGIEGIIGNRYKLRIEHKGNIYSSEFETLKEPTPISSVEAKLEYRPSPNAQIEVPGYQFYVSTEESPYENDYFLWKLEGSYKYESQLLIYYVFEGSFKNFNNHDSLKVCYRNYDIGQIFTSNTNNLLEAKIVEKPIFFLPAIDLKLSKRYSLLTKQYSVSKEAYTFWHGVEQQIANSESLYTSQPYQIRGNIRNINDPDEAVLGYFLVAGINRNRIFVDKPSENAIYIEPCGFDTEGLPFIVFTGPSEWPIYITKDEEGNNALSGYGCLDCQELGGELEKPDFWEE